MISYPTTTVGPHLNPYWAGLFMQYNRLLASIRGNEHKARMSLLREPGISDADYKACKARLPYFVPTGTYSYRNNDGLTAHNSCVHIDIDKLG